MLTDEMRSDLLRGLCDMFKDSIERIILYGSVARNEASTDSDIDIAIILSSAMNRSKLQDLMSWASELDLKYNRVFSIVDISRDKLDQWGEVLPFYKNIQKEGIVLWKAA